jgi:hypothetical protein
VTVAGGWAGEPSRRVAREPQEIFDYHCVSQCVCYELVPELAKAAMQPQLGELIVRIRMELDWGSQFKFETLLFDVKIMALMGDVLRSRLPPPMPGFCAGAGPGGPCVAQVVPWPPVGVLGPIQRVHGTESRTGPANTAPRPFAGECHGAAARSQEPTHWHGMQTAGQTTMITGVEPSGRPRLGTAPACG